MSQRTQSRKTRIAIVLMLGLLLPASHVQATNVCALPGSGIGGTGIYYQDGGIGGTGIEADQSGIGGTGKTGIGGTGIEAGRNGIGGTGKTGIGGTGAPTQRSGIGGTGIHLSSGGIGGTGIIGRITGFGSICVNGLEIHYRDSTPVRLDGQHSSTTQLALGQIVAVKVLSGAQGLWASEIRIVDAVTGPVNTIDAGRSVIHILGQQVRIVSDTVIAAGNGQSTVIHPGNRIRVSGLHTRNGIIVASRIDMAPPGRLVSVSGQVSVASGHGFRIAGLDVRAPQGSIRTDVSPGAQVQVRGIYSEGQLHAIQVNSAAIPSISHQVDELVVQGYVTTGKNGLQVNDITLKLPPRDTHAPQVGQRIIVSGQVVTQGQLEVHKLIIEGPVLDIPDTDRHTVHPTDGNHDEHQMETHDTGAGNLPTLEFDAPGNPRDATPEIDTPEPPETPDAVEPPEVPEAVEPPELPDTPDVAEPPEPPAPPEIVAPPEPPQPPEPPEPPQPPEPPEIDD